MEYTVGFNILLKQDNYSGTIILRYSQIKVFLEVLKKEQPGSAIPSLRQYSLLGNVSQTEELSSRRISEIEDILTYVSTHKHLKHSNTFLLFLRDTDKFKSQSVLEKMNTSFNSTLAYDTPSEDKEEYIESEFATYFEHQKYFASLQTTVEAYMNFSNNTKQLIEDSFSSLDSLKVKLSDTSQTKILFSKSLDLLEVLNQIDCSTPCSLGEVNETLLTLEEIQIKVCIINEAIERRFSKDIDLSTYHLHLEYEIDLFKRNYEAELVNAFKIIKRLVETAAKLDKILKKSE